MSSSSVEEEESSEIDTSSFLTSSPASILQNSSEILSDESGQTRSSTKRTASEVSDSSESKRSNTTLESDEQSGEKSDQSLDSSESESEEEEEREDNEDNISVESGSSDSSNSSECSGNSNDEALDNSPLLPVYDGCELTVHQGVLQILELFAESKLKKRTLKKILANTLKFLPTQNNFPKSVYALFKYVEKICPSVTVKQYFYCSICHFYIGPESKACPLKCESNIGSYYVYSIRDQLKNMFEKHHLGLLMNTYNDNRRNQADCKLRDVSDGQEYKRVKLQLDGKYDVILLGHTDGISISESSKVSLWPIEFVICELPHNLRYKFVLVGGIWVDNSKPNMHCFLKPCVDELQQLSVHGVEWKHPETNEQIISKVTAPCFCVDAPVRAALQNILGHAGKSGCHTCEQKTVKLPAEPVLPGVRRKKRIRVYMPHFNTSTLRTHERMDEQGRLSRTKESLTGKLVPKKGVRGAAIVSQIPFCDRSTVVYPEYMHILLGLIPKFVELLFEIDGNWSLKEFHDEVNIFLQSIQVPDFITRIPRSTESCNSWKANECRSFLLYFSLIIFSKFMNDEYLNHWMLFVGGVYILLQEEITHEEIEKAEIMLNTFVTDFVHLYEAKYITYNLHCLTHFAITVRRWGPLSCNAAFPFENFNGDLQRSIHGTKNQAAELIKTVKLCQDTKILKAIVNQQTSCKETTIMFLSKIKRIQDISISIEIRGLLKDVMVESWHYRAKIDNQTFTCRSYKRQKKRNNYTVCYSDQEYNIYGEVVYYIECTDKRKKAIVQCFEVTHNEMFIHETGFVLPHLIPIRLTPKVTLINIEQILCKVIRVGDFVCLRPNKHEENL